MASVVNKRLASKSIRPHGVFRFQIDEYLRFPKTRRHNKNQKQISNPATVEVDVELDEKHITNTRPWHSWNRLRDHPRPDTHIGLWLEFTTAFEGIYERAPQMNRRASETLRSRHLYFPTAGVLVPKANCSYGASSMETSPYKRYKKRMEYWVAKDIAKCAWGSPPKLMHGMKRLIDGCLTTSGLQIMFSIHIMWTMKTMSLATDIKLESTDSDHRIVIMILGAGHLLTLW